MIPFKELIAFLGIGFLEKEVLTLPFDESSTFLEMPTVFDGDS